jgi:hypothetical protein
MGFLLPVVFTKFFQRGPNNLSDPFPRKPEFQADFLQSPGNFRSKAVSKLEYPSGSLRKIPENTESHLFRPEYIRFIFSDGRQEFPDLGFPARMISHFSSNGLRPHSFAADEMLWWRSFKRLLSKSCSFWIPWIIFLPPR